MKHLSCHEWDYIEIGEGPDRVTRIEADALLRLAAAAAPSLGLADGDSGDPGGGERILLDGRHRLRLQQVVGVMVTGSVTLEILPKTDRDGAACRSGLIAMMAAAGDTRIATRSSATLDSQSDDLLDIMIAGFARDLLAALRPGLPQGYLPRHEDLAALRGRLDAARQLSRLAGRADLLACRHDELSADTGLNRILRAAARLLHGLARRPANRRLLAESLALLDGVGPLPAGALPAVRFTRLTQRFQPVHALACQFLRHTYQGVAAGRRGGVAILFRMNQLFESWIGAVLRRGLTAQGWSVHLQASGQVRHALQRADRALFAMYPDILLQCAGQHVILDTKWKRLAPLAQEARRRVMQADVYQLLAYRQAWQARLIAMIYPGAGPACTIDRLHIPGLHIPFLLIEVPVAEPRTGAVTILQQISAELAGI